jgi:hypothetical protein
VWLVAVAGAHNSRALRAATTWSVIFITAAVTFYALNKTGVGVSIHSFVTSNVIKSNHLALSVTALALLTALGLQCRAFALLCALVYTSLGDARVLKRIAVASVWCSAAPNSWQRPLHAAVRLSSLLLLLLNLHNVPLTGAAGAVPSVSHVFAGDALQLGRGDTQIIRSAGWRSKPMLTHGSCFKSSYLRSPSGRSR